MNRALRTALALQATGAVLALVAAGRPWLRALVQPPPPLPSRTVELAGTQLGSPSRALALVALAGVVAVLAARGLLRLGVGAVVALCGGLMVADGGRVLLDRDAVLLGRGLFLEQATLTPWPALLVLAGLLVLAAGLLVTARGRHWGGLSKRYDAPAARPVEQPAPAASAGESVEAAPAWDALDRGEDPTRDSR